MVASPSDYQKRRALLKSMSEKYLSQMRKEMTDDTGPSVQDAPGE